MSNMEDIELEKLRKALDSDVKNLVDKYLKEMEWDIPDVDEPRARRLILEEIEKLVQQMAAGA
ncbi:MAG: hypothetical protein HWE39_24455 [Oceanospirillaceae bacterium]|nr:hypothetical protein [Oceanospirillaceae bacterium]